VYRDPTAALVRPHAAPAKEKRALTDDERIIVERVSKEHRHGALTAVMYYMGLRRGEALGLAWGDIDWRSDMVHIQRDIDYTYGAIVDDLKSQAADRYIPIGKDLRTILEPLKKDDNNSFVFCSRVGKPLAAASFLRRWMSLMIACGFAVYTPRKPKGGKRIKTDVRFDWQCEITPHYLRHDYATRLFEAGVIAATAMRLLGHADYNTTLKLYTHIRQEILRKAGQELENKQIENKVAIKLPNRKPLTATRKKKPLKPQ
jgi:integrase